MNSFYDIERRTTGRYCVHAEMQLTREINIEALKMLSDHYWWF